MWGFLLLVISASCAGYAVFGFRRAENFEAAAYRLLTGLILVALFTIVVGSWSTGAVRHGMIWFAVLMLFVFTFRRRAERSESKLFDAAAALKPTTLFEWCIASAILATGIAAFISAWAPSTSWDAAAAHLALPKDYVREGRIALQPGNAYSAYPHLLHALYTATFVIDGERGPALTHWCLSMMAIGFVASMATRIAGRTAGWAAAGILATAPIFADQAGAVAIDMGFAAFLIAAWRALMKWNDSGHGRDLFLAAILAGSACGIRHTGYVVVVVMAVAIILLPRRSIASLTTFVLLAWVAAAPWLIRSTLLTGNPVYPLLGAWFDAAGPADHVVSALGQHESLRGTSLGAFALFPWQIIMRPFDFDGLSQSPGPWVLLFAVPGVIWGGWRARTLAGVNVAGGAALFFFRQYARYYLPFFVPLMAVAGVGVAKTPHWRRLSQVLIALGCVYGAAYAVGAIHFKVPVVFRLQDREAYLSERVERYGAYQWINKNIPSNERVLVSDFRGYYIRGRTYQNLEALYPLIEMPVRDQLDWLNAQGIRYWVYPEAYVAESPGFGEKGLEKLFRNWRRFAQFELVHDIRLPRRDGSYERVEIYRINS